MTQKNYSRHYRLVSLTLLLLAALVFPGGSALAQDPSPHSRKAEAIQSGRIPLEGSLPSNAEVVSADLTELVQDGGFEAYVPGPGSPYWTESDSWFGTPLCTTDPDDCDIWLDAQPRSGTAWAWFGGTSLPDVHTASISQNVMFPACGTGTLSFYFWIGYVEPGGGSNDVFNAKIDGMTVFSATAAQAASYSAYTRINVDVNSFASGAAHTLEFSHMNTGQDVGFHLDDVSLVFATEKCLVAGSVGTGGATLSYTDGTAKTVVSQPNGKYTLTVSPGWSGTVTPTHPCYTFNPLSIDYTNVLSNQMDQNYAAAFTPAPACANTVGVFRPSNGVIFLRNSNTTGFADVALNYGLAGDYPVVGDWDGDGDDTIGVYRSGRFLLRNSNTVGFAEINFLFGQPGDQPIAGDWDGDGDDTIGVYRPSTGAFYLKYNNDASPADRSFFLGNVGDVAIAGDWDGDGDDTTGVFRPSNGVIFLKNVNLSGFADVALNYGLPGDKPVVGDWDNDGDTTIGIFRSGRFYLRNSNTNGFADILLDLGFPTDMPIAGNWDALP